MCPKAAAFKEKRSLMLRGYSKDLNDKKKREEEGCFL
ncbi:hypothetical protein NEOC95_002058 [Neochlamydia sp. AcF95]|nr:hypothetical protein [Neochlamydia sp. AcF95]